MNNGGLTTVAAARRTYTTYTTWYSHPENLSKPTVRHCWYVRVFYTKKIVYSVQSAHRVGLGSLGWIYAAVRPTSNIFICIPSKIRTPEKYCRKNSPLEPPNTLGRGPTESFLGPKIKTNVVLTAVCRLSRRGFYLVSTWARLLTEWLVRPTAFVTSTLPCATCSWVTDSDWGGGGVYVLIGRIRSDAASC